MTEPLNLIDPVSDDDIDWVCQLMKLDSLDAPRRNFLKSLTTVVGHGSRGLAGIEYASTRPPASSRTLNAGEMASGWATASCMTPDC